MKLIFLAFALALLAGCTTHRYSLHPITRGESMRAGASALVALPEDGRFGQISYSGTGRQVARSVATALAKHCPRVDIMQNTNAPLESARAGGFDYLITPRIIHWEDRATEWSGKPDRIEIELRTQAVKDGATVNLGSVEGRTGTFALTSSAPQDMLLDPINSYVAWLFSPPSTPQPLVAPPSAPRTESPKGARR